MAVQTDRGRITDQAHEVYRTLRLVRDRILARHQEVIAPLTQRHKGPALTPKQVHVLSTIREEGETSVKNLANRLCETSPSVSAMVDRLHEKGLLNREFDTADRRRVVISLSPKGQQFVAQVEQLIIASFADTLEEIGGDCAEKLADVCLRIRTFLDDKR